MIKRTIELSREPAHLCVRLNQLTLTRGHETVGSIPCEDIGVVVVDHPQATYTHAALATLAKADATLVVCGPDHLPVGILLPLSDHTQVVWRAREQISASKPLCKRLWQQIVQAKIRAQADNLAKNAPARRRLLQLATEVRSGDPTNIEAQAAKAYWSAWLTQAPEDHRTDRATFRRDPDGDGANPLLNYGYAVMRAAVARSIVAAGLLPSLGLHHSHRANAFCLADDLLEPLRPIVDERVRRLLVAGQTDLDQPTKAALLELLAVPMSSDQGQGPLLVALERYAASLVQCFQGLRRRLEIPKPCESVDTDACGS
jgi:CRISPR-associated protein Cas1